MALEKELETYKEKLPELLANEGKFVLIHDSQVVDIFDSYGDALRQGYRQFGTTPFLVKRIQASEQVQIITRLVSPIHTH